MNEIKQREVLDRIFDFLKINNKSLFNKFLEESNFEEKIKKSRYNRICLKCGEKILSGEKYFSQSYNILGNFSYCIKCFEKTSKTIIDKENKKIKFLLE